MRPVIGWREWLALPELGVDVIKVKVDTGARSSAIHAHNVTCYERDGQQRVRFTIRPRQRDASVQIKADCELHDMRHVRSSTGHEQLRPVIITPVTLKGVTFDIELTLTNRDAMGFRMLLGRSAVRKRFLINAGRSFISKHPPPPPGHRRPKKTTRKKSS